MAESNKGKLIVGIIALVLVCTLFGAFGGAITGGVAGYLVGRQAAEAVAQRATGAPQSRQGQSIVPQPTIPFPDQLPQPPDWGFQWPEGQPRQPSGRLAVTAQVETVVTGSPAERSGIRAGDSIVAVDGQALSPARGLAQIIAGHKPGDQVTLTLIRGGQEIKVQVTLGASPNDANRGYLGLTYQTVFSAERSQPSN